MTFSDLFVAWFDRQPEWKQDQVQASFREMFAAVERMGAAVDTWEQAGVDAAEEHANGEGK